MPPSVFRKQYLVDVTSPTLLKDYDAMPQGTDTEKQAKVDKRNKILTELIALIDQNYSVFRTDTMARMPW